MKFMEHEGDGTYKISQIEKHLESCSRDEYYHAQLTGADGKSINIGAEALNLLKRYYSGEEILFRNDYIATKLWSREDVQAQLVENGYEGTDEEIDAVINTGYLKALGDCTDQDWNVIDYAINEAASYGNIVGRDDKDEQMV